jgi:c-di-GMP-binding flagellar brake protein YcgR
MTEQPQETAQKERRKSPRTKIAISIEFKTEGAAVASRAETADLSLFGCYVEMSFTLPVGTRMNLTLWVEDARLPTRALVVTHHPQFGNGIEFLDMSQEDRAKLEQFLLACEKRAEEKREGKPSS